MKINLKDYMSEENAIEFIRILFENKNEQNKIGLELPSGQVAELNLNSKLYVKRSIDSE